MEARGHAADSLPACRVSPRVWRCLPVCREKVIPEATAWFTGEALMEDEDDEVRSAGQGSAGWLRAAGCRLPGVCSAHASCVWVLCG